MGNPHCVTFVDELSDALVLGLGAQIEMNSAFPRRVNAEFATVLSPHEIRLRVWERGAGETLACGTGTCATAVAAVCASDAIATRTIVPLKTGPYSRIAFSISTCSVRCR